MPASHSHDIFHDTLENLNELLACLIIWTIFVGLRLIIATSVVVWVVILFTPFVMFAAFLLGNMYSAWFFLVISICMLATHRPYPDKNELMQMTIEWLHGEA